MTNSRNNAAYSATLQTTGAKVDLMSGGVHNVWMPGGVRTEIHLVGNETGGAFCLFVDHPPPGWTLPPHRHRNEAETIYIVEGSFSMDVEGSSSRLSAGDSVHVPRGVIHSGANLGTETGRRVVVFSPAGMEDFFEEVGRSTPGEFDRTTARASAVRHGWDFISTNT